MQDVELLTANSLLKRGVRYKVPAPLLLKALGKKHVSINITQLRGGTELRIAALLCKYNLTEETIETPDTYKFMIEHYSHILKVVAISTLNRRFLDPVSLYFRICSLKRLTVWRLFELYTTVKKFSGVGPFMNITRLSVSTRMTKPNLGQESGS